MIKLVIVDLTFEDFPPDSCVQVLVIQASLYGVMQF
jgi:hypothetical protein